METAPDAGDAELLRLASNWADWASSLAGAPPGLNRLLPT